MNHSSKRELEHGYRIVKLANGTHSIHSLAYGETFHPVIGPIAEAEALYVRQLGLVERLQRHAGEFVIWDVGLGAAANVIAVLQATRELACTLHFVSFDHTLEPVKFALQNAQHLRYLAGYEQHLGSLLQNQQSSFERGAQAVRWPSAGKCTWPISLPCLNNPPRSYCLSHTPSCSMLFHRPRTRQCGLNRSSPIYSSCWTPAVRARYQPIPGALCYASRCCWLGFLLA
jgi:hypothetical protein